MLQAQWCKYRLNFVFDAITSRETMRAKDTYFVRVFDSDRPDATIGVGECALFKGLSADDLADYEATLSAMCRAPRSALTSSYSSIRFGFEMALRRCESTEWSRGDLGIPINGLIWMGDKATMVRRIKEKLDAGFKVLKLKIGGINFDDELDLLRYIRREYRADILEIRLDANGSFKAEEALDRLNKLSEYGIHSLEQPIKAGQAEAMALICSRSPIAIALDEELIGTRSYDGARRLVEDIRPQYLVLKPALCGGFSGADDYVDIANTLGIGWWATSALESNVGLYAIARWVASKAVAMPQGLGTGQLYSNNIPSPLELRGSSLWCNQARAWGDMTDMPWRQ
ncbi:MAG: o-succinylbenzoate synthase [Muribaculaceae bacterium]|nr:o-succinylbenzoate synthase [Muribaculaceae bacterium]